MDRQPRSQKESSRTWILGCFAASLVALVAALVEAPFHQTPAMELALVSIFCFLGGFTGWLSVAAGYDHSSYPAQRTASVIVGSLPAVSVTEEQR